MEKTCIICGKSVESSDVVNCAICGASMHRSCAHDETLLDAEENTLCPYDAIIAALDWFDAVITVYADTLSEEQRNDIIERLKSYLNLLESKENIK